MQPQANQPASQQNPNTFQPPKKSKKKTVLAIILVVLLVAAVGAGAWWYGNNQAQKSATEKIQDLQSQVDDLQRQATRKAESKDNNTKQESTSKYLVIKEWEVRLPLTSDIYDSLYVLGGQSTLVRLSTESMARLDSTCDPRQNGDSQAAMGRDLPTATAFEGTPIKDAYPIGKELDDGYYYYFVHPQSTCAKNTALETKITSAFKAAILSVESIK